MDDFCLYIIQDGDTLSEIAKTHKLDPAKWREEIWEHEFNLSIRACSNWPDWATDENHLPTGYGIYVPGHNQHHCIIDEKQSTRTFQEKRRLLGELRFAIYNYKSYENTHWVQASNNQTQRNNLVDTGFRYNYHQIYSEASGRMFAYAELARRKAAKAKYRRSEKNPDEIAIGDEYLLIDKNTGEELVDSSALENLFQRLKNETGKIFFPVQGDPDKTNPMQEGWVYIFEKDGNTYRYNTYQVENGKYQKVRKIGDEYRKFGDAEEFMEIGGYFPINRADAAEMGPYFVIVSDFALTKQRLNELKNDPSVRGKKLVQSDIALLDANNRKHDLNKSNETFREAKIEIRNTETHDFRIHTFKKQGEDKAKEGLILNLPNPLKETQKRVRAFQDAYGEYNMAINNQNDNTQKKRFLYGVLISLHKNAQQYGSDLKLYDHIDEKKFLNDQGNLQRLYWEREEAAYHLIAWLRGLIFREMIADYTALFSEDSSGDPEDDTEAETDYHFQLAKILDEAYAPLILVSRGKEFMLTERKDPKSIYNLLFAQLSNSYYMGPAVHASDTENVLNVGQASIYNQPGIGIINPARKLNGHLISIVYTFSPAIAIKIGTDKWADAIEAFSQEVIKQYDFGSLSRHNPGVNRGRLSENVENARKRITHLELGLNKTDDFLSSAPKKLAFDSLNCVLQAANLFITLFPPGGKKTSEMSEEEFARYAMNGVGATLDLITSFDFVGERVIQATGKAWTHYQAMLAPASKTTTIVEQGVASTKSALKTFSKGLLILNLASSMIDFCMAANDMYNHVKDGHIDLAIGSGIAMTGHLLSAASSVLLYAAFLGEGALLSSWTGIGGVVCGIAAIICCLIAFAITLCHKTDMQKWMERCVFGKSADSTFSIDNQIKDLFKLISGFKVDTSISGRLINIKIAPSLLTRQSILSIKDMRVVLVRPQTEWNTHSGGAGPSETIELNLNLLLRDQQIQGAFTHGSRRFETLFMDVTFRSTENLFVKEVMINLQFPSRDLKAPFLAVWSFNAEIELQIENSIFHQKYGNKSLREGNYLQFENPKEQISRVNDISGYVRFR